MAPPNLGNVDDALLHGARPRLEQIVRRRPHRGEDDDRRLVAVRVLHDAQDLGGLYTEQTAKTGAHVAKFCSILTKLFSKREVQRQSAVGKGNQP